MREKRDALLAQLVAHHGVRYVGCERVHEMGTDALRVYIDKPGGVTLDDCAEVNRVLNIELAAEAMLGRNEVLQVSSPGVDRPLFSQEDYAQFVGSVIRVKMLVAQNGRKRFKGALQAVSSESITVEVDGEKFQLGLADIEKANVCNDLG